MKISLIAALSDDGVIGRNNALPWRLPTDMKRFKKLTMGKPVIMGRKTWESIGKPLSGRTNIIVSRDPGFEASGCTVVSSIVEALAEAEEVKEVMVIGGSSVYEALLPQADNLYLTYVHAAFEGDVHFPDIDMEDWRETSRKSFEADESNAHAYTFVTLRRKFTTQKPANSET